MARLLSVNVGLPRDIQWKGRTVHTAIWKDPVPGPCRVRRLNLDGDGQGDLAGHGGEQRAVFVYQIESYRYWQAQLKRSDFVHGQFGENFTIEGLADDDVCIGDRYRIGSALFEVTQPRVTCAYARVFPGGSDYPYNFATASGYSRFKDLNGLDFAGVVQKAGLGMSPNEVGDKTAKARDLVRGELLVLVDYIQAPPQK